MLQRVCFLSLLLCGLHAQSWSSTRSVMLGGRTIPYEAREGLAIIEGDIVLGTVEDIEAAARAEASGSKDNGKLRRALLILNTLGNPPLWPDGVIPYTIDPALPNPQRVTDAIAHWNSRTPFKLFPRAAETDYIRFVPLAGTCATNAGRAGGAQSVVLDTGCSTGTVIHEIGHVFGLLHEQARTDRNTWLTVLHENIDTTSYRQFTQGRASRDLNYYDYGSIMHYSNVAFSKNGKATMETVPPGIPIGQSNGLSAADIDNISRTYGFIPTQTTVTTIPEGLPFFADGEQYISPRAFEWAPGSTHNLRVDTNHFPTSISLPARYGFVRWTDGGSPEHTYTASAGQTVVAAEFAQSFQLSIQLSTGIGTATVTPPSPDGYYVAGTSVQVSAQPAAGQTFYNWLGGFQLEQSGIGYGSPDFTLELNGNLLLPLSFTRQPVTTLDSSPTGRLVTVDGRVFRTPIRFTWIAGSDHVLSVSSPQTPFSGSTRVFFSAWEDGSTSLSRSVQASAEDKTFSIQFAEQHRLDFTPVGPGSLDVVPFQPTQPYIAAGTMVEMFALPAAGSAVQYWLGDVSGTSPSQPLLMDRPRRAVVVMGAPIPFRLTHAASYAVSPFFEQSGITVAPLEIVTLFGDNLGPATLLGGQIDSQGRLSSNIGNTRILFDGVPAPIVYASAGQTSVVVPAEVAGRATTTVVLERDGQPAGSLPVAVAPAIPGIFTYNSSGSGPVAALNQDGSIHSKDRAAAPGSVMVLYATGAGLMDRTLANGEVMGSNLARPLAPVYVRIGKEPAEIVYAGSAPFLVNGALQVNVRVPANLTPGEWPVRIIMGNVSSGPGTTIFVK
jgi:astacin